jgi:hypothetical protein
MEAVNNRLASQDAEIRSLREELQTRAAVPVIPPPEPIDLTPALASLREYVDASVTRAVAEIPKPENGKDGRDGAPGERGTDGAPGERGADGLNGRDGTPGERGERGADGIATREELDSLIEARFAEVQTRTFADIYRGTFDPKQGIYARGLTTTYDGSLWLSERDTDRQPGTIDSGWKLITKRGRDGRDRK